jgi:hypothetical protein
MYISTAQRFWLLLTPPKRELEWNNEPESLRNWWTRKVDHVHSPRLCQRRVTIAYVCRILNGLDTVSVNERVLVFLIW